MRLYYCDEFELPLPAGHRFPIVKYQRLRERISTASWARHCQLLVPEAATDEQLLLVHKQQYLECVKQGRLADREIRRLGFPWSAGLVERSRRSTGATIAAAQSAMYDGASANLAGGTHHAFADAGEGFCVFNDTVVAARVLQRSGAVQRAIIIDCDVHQGNGTAAIVNSDPTIYSFSIHGAKNFPLRKSISDMDVALPDETSDTAYLTALADTLPRALDAARADLAFYIAGADPFLGDRYGRMKMSKEGLARRDAFVFEQCYQRRLSLAIVMGGGYAAHVEDIVDIHETTICTACRYQQRWIVR